MSGEGLASCLFVCADDHLRRTHETYTHTRHVTRRHVCTPCRSHHDVRDVSLPWILARCGSNDAFIRPRTPTSASEMSVLKCYSASLAARRSLLPRVPAPPPWTRPAPSHLQRGPAPVRSVPSPPVEASAPGGETGREPAGRRSSRRPDPRPGGSHRPRPQSEHVEGDGARGKGTGARN